MGRAEFAAAMKNLFSKSSLKIPEGVTVDVKARVVVVKGPRGTLTKSFKHMQVDLYKPDADTVQVEKWFSQSKEQSAIKTCISHIQNMITGVTKGFKYHMQKVKFHVDAVGDTKVDRAPGANTELMVTGNNIEDVSRTCALISQSCAVKRKDIRKFLDGIY